jgi:hypothetical protein
MDRFFQILSDGVHRFEGTVDKFTGNGIMAIFGAPIAHEDHARRACYAALHLKEELRRYAEELKRTREISFAVRMGLNSGEVVVGAIGDDLKMSTRPTVTLRSRRFRTPENRRGNRVHEFSAQRTQMRTLRKTALDADGHKFCGKSAFVLAVHVAAGWPMWSASVGGAFIFGFGIIYARAAILGRSLDCWRR